MVAPATEGLELAVTVKTEPVVTPLAGELTVIMSFVVWGATGAFPLVAWAAGRLSRLAMLTIAQRNTVCAEFIEL
jgi:hypothetical protein